MAESEHGSRTEPARDAIQLARTLQTVQMQLSAMADHKASILMGATFVVFTIALTKANDSHLGVPMLILGSFSFLAALLAVLAVIPAVRPRPDAPLNLLFFGSFTQLGEEEYIERLYERLCDNESVIRTMARDIYQNGAVLAHKKYRFLGYAYRVFVVGLVTTVIVVLGEYFI